MAELPKDEPLVISVFFIGKEGLTMTVRKLKEFLDSNKIKYDTIMHTPSYTAQEIAASAHLSGKEVAKTVLVKIDGKMTMIVLPASSKIDLGLLKKKVGADKVELAAEREFERRFPDCDLGAMPPFGNLYGMDVFVADKLTRDVEIAFNAGSHTELIKLAYKDFEKLVHPKIANISC
jgi:Ala-tRNA(Pro) deacylase